MSSKSGFEFPVMAVRDHKAEVWLSPMVVRTLGTGQRSFEDALEAKEGQLGKHPGDFSLWLIGNFDEREGVLLPCTHQLVMSGADWVASRGHTNVVAIDMAREAKYGELQSDVPK